MDGNDEIKTLTAIIQGATTHKSTYEEKVAVGSTLINRRNSGKAEFGIDNVPPMTISEVANSNTSPYYEVNGSNERYNEVMAGKVAPYNEKEAKRSLQIASGLIKGTIEPVDGEFFYTDEEVKKLTKNKGHDFKKTVTVGRVGKYNLFAYPKKESPKGRKKEKDGK